MKKVILDLDTGIDDAMALAYILGSPEVQLAGVTGTYGNVSLRQGLRNSLALLDLLGHPEVPVFAGQPHALLACEDYETSGASAFIHGPNGIGGVEVPDSPRSPEAEPAVDFLIRMANECGPDLIYVPTGPLTNLTCALQRDPAACQKIGRVVLMGGALTVCGNVTPAAEANISKDPEAADQVFRSGLATTMVGLDVTLQTLLTPGDVDEWHHLGTGAATAYASIVDYYIWAYAQRQPYLGGCGLHDPLAAAVALDPSLVTTVGINLQVDLEGELRGRTIGDLARLNDPRKSTQVALGVDIPRFMQNLMSRVGRALGGGR